MSNVAKVDSFGVGGSMDFRFRCSNDNLSEFVTNKVDDSIKTFTSKFADNFSNVSIDLDLKKGYIRVKGVPEYECRINLITDTGMFYAKENGIGAVKAVSSCLSQLETQIRKKQGRYETRVPTRGRDPYMMSEFEDT